MSSVPPAFRPSRSAPPRGGRNRRRPLIPEQYLRLPGKATWDDYVELSIYDAVKSLRRRRS